MQPNQKFNSIREDSKLGIKQQYRRFQKESIDHFENSSTKITFNIVEICIQTKITLKNNLVRKHLITEFLQYFCIIF